MGGGEQRYMSRQELKWERYDLLRMRWRLINRAMVDPQVLPAALDWIDSEVARIEKALGGVGAA